MNYGSEAQSYRFRNPLSFELEGILTCTYFHEPVSIIKAEPKSRNTAEHIFVLISNKCLFEKQ